MADDIDILDAGGNTKSVATDDAGAAGHVQIIKLALSADGSAAVIGADSNGLDVDPTRMPAFGASPETSAIYNGTTALTPKFAKIDAASSGNNTLVAAVTSKKVRVVSLFLVVAAAVTVKFQSGAGGTDLTGAMSFAANGGIALPFDPAGHFETASATLLNMSLGGAQQVSGGLTYVEV